MGRIFQEHQDGQFPGWPQGGAFGMVQLGWWERGQGRSRVSGKLGGRGFSLQQKGVRRG